MRRALLLLLTAAVLTALAVGGVVLVRDSDDDEPAAAPPAPAPPARLADVDTTALVVTRAGFCEAVPAEAAEAALGAEPTATTAYDNGERAELVPGVTDVAHEFGCTWTTAGAEARAWVFAPPVTVAAARSLATAAAGPGCRPLPDAAAFGTSGVGLVCGRGARQEVSYRGLFGDAWLVCTLRGVTADDPLAERADRWCAAVAQAAAS